MNSYRVPILDSTPQNNEFATYSVGTTLECAAKCLENMENGISDCHLNKGNGITCPECYRIEPDTMYHEHPRVSTTFTLLTK